MRFLGRRVFYGAVVVLSCIEPLTAQRVRQLSELLRVDRRTLRRWCRWWREQLAELAWWRVARGRFVPPPQEQHLPGSLLARFTGAFEEQLVALLGFFSALTTHSA